MSLIPHAKTHATCQNGMCIAVKLGTMTFNALEQAVLVEYDAALQLLQDA